MPKVTEQLQNSTEKPGSGKQGGHCGMRPPKFHFHAVFYTLLHSGFEHSWGWGRSQQCRPSSSQCSQALSPGLRGAVRTRNSNDSSTWMHKPQPSSRKRFFKESRQAEKWALRCQARSHNLQEESIQSESGLTQTSWLHWLVSHSTTGPSQRC